MSGVVSPLRLGLHLVRRLGSVVAPRDSSRRAYFTYGRSQRYGMLRGA